MAHRSTTLGLGLAYGALLTAAEPSAGEPVEDADLLESQAELLAAYAGYDGTLVSESGMMYTVLDAGRKGYQVFDNATVYYRYNVSVFGAAEQIVSMYDDTRPIINHPPDINMQGISEVIPLMSPKARWELVLPASMNNGSLGNLTVPADVALRIEVELVLLLPARPWLIYYMDKVQLWFLPVAILLSILKLLIDRYLGVVHVYAGKKLPLKLVRSKSNAFMKDNPHVYFDIQINGKPQGRIKIELFGKICLSAVDNFVELCTGTDRVSATNKKKSKWSYKGTKFFKILPGKLIQGGDITLNNGKGGASIFGATFADDWKQGWIAHDAKYLVSLASKGPNTNNSQFCITLSSSLASMNLKNTVIGEVTEGYDVIAKMEACGTKDGIPTKDVVISKCARLPTPKHKYTKAE